MSRASPAAERRPARGGARDIDNGSVEHGADNGDRAAGGEP